VTLGWDTDELDYIKAVSFLRKEEWQELESWKDYVDAQKKAAKGRDVSVKRIFITDIDDLKSKLAFLEVVKMHSLDRYDETHLEGYFMDSKNKGSYNKNIMGDGFLLIKSKNEYLAVIDHFTETEKVGRTDNKNDENKIMTYKNDLVFNTDILRQIEEYFDTRVDGLIQDALPRFKLDGSLVQLEVKK
jgi:hypothetical protein